MTAPSDVLTFARQQIGYKEGRNNDSLFGRWYGMNNAPWCATFVSWCFARAGLPLPATTALGFAYCPYGVAWFKKQNRWKTGNPQAGDVVFFAWSGKVAVHVGIVESVNADGSIMTIEGNTNSAGSAEGLYVMRQRRRTGILGYGTPNYGTKTPIVVPFVPADRPKTTTTVLGQTKEGNVTVKSVRVNDIHLDKEGNGWTILEGGATPRVEFKNLVGVTLCGPAPERDGYGWPNPVNYVNDTNGLVLISFEQGTPMGVVSCVVSYMEN